MFVDRKTLRVALQKMYGTAGLFFRIWVTLKHMGLKPGTSLVIDTSNSTPSLQRLFSYGDPEGGLFIPFGHTARYLTMKGDASRSIIQSTIKRWATDGSVVGCDPTGFLDFKVLPGPKYEVSTGRQYPFGLGAGEAGFALKDGARLAIPLSAFAVWYGRHVDIATTDVSKDFLVSRMLNELNISSAERELIFVDDDLDVGLQADPISELELYELCQEFVQGKEEVSAEIHAESFEKYSRRAKSMVSGLEKPTWMRTSPDEDLRELIQMGAKAILLFGPPRTGKTRQIDGLFPRGSSDRETIQIHDGWGYDHLVQGFKPDQSGVWKWESGPLKKAIEDGKKCIVLEEINRTAISQSLGEVFSLIEDSYRGEENAIFLRNGDRFFIPKDTVFLMTMNTVDKSTEEIDDALMGRVYAVEFPPRPEDLTQMLADKGVDGGVRERLVQLFVEILSVYPLGHGYFNGLVSGVKEGQVILYYKSRVRPVLVNFFGELKGQEVSRIDNLVDEMFGSK